MIKSPTSEKIMDRNRFKNLYYNTNLKNHHHTKFRILKLVHFEKPKLEVLSQFSHEKTEEENLVSGTWTMVSRR